MIKFVERFVQIFNPLQKGQKELASRNISI